MARIRQDNVRGTLDLAGLNGTDTTSTMQATNLAELQTVASPNIAVIVLDPDEQEGPAEIVWITAHTSGASTATITRAQEGSSRRIHSIGEQWVHGPTILDYLTTDQVRQSAFGGQEKYVDHGSSGSGTVTIDLATGNVHKLSLTGNPVIAFTGAVAGLACSWFLVLAQDGTGGRTVTWPSGTKWDEGEAPTLSTAANAVDIFSFLTSDGGTTLYGFIRGIGLSATPGSTVGPVGDATHSPAVTIDGRGRIVALSSILITGTTPGGAAGGALAGSYPNPTAGPMTITTQSAAYQFVLADQQTRVEYTGAGAANFTIPAHATVAFPVGTVIEVAQEGAGQVTVVAAGGVTMHSDGGKVKTAAQYATIGLVQRAIDDWRLTGDLA